MEKKGVRNKKDERGAAMVMVLLIALLLLTASAGLLLETSMNTQNVTDATAEQQAYNAAESGLQSAINVLRGNVVPSPLLDTSKPATDPANLINFRKAINLATSNENVDTSVVPRLSRWLKYNYAPGGASLKDRITLGSTAASYNPHDGFAYSLSITDPDDTGQIISFKTEGQFYDPVAKTWIPGSPGITVGTVPNTALVVYEGVTSPDLDVSDGLETTNFGKFKVNSLSMLGGGVVLAENLRFRIIVTMTAPYNSVKVMRGWIKLKSGSNSIFEFDFDSPAYDVRGSLFKFTNDPLEVSIGGNATINGSVTPAEPYRVIVRSVGFGPRGARKELEATVQKNFFNGLSAPATLTLIGSTNGFHFKPGTSNNVTYSGDDIASTLNIPSIGTTNDTNLQTITNELNAQAVKTVPVPPAENVLIEVPFWLSSPKNLDDTVKDLRNVAKASGKYFANGQAPNNFGNLATATGITFIEGNGEFSGNGGGILVCTGKLTLHGNFSFNGLIIVTGTDGIQRTGGGNGLLAGNTVVAPYNPANLNADFLAPKYDISGGGNSTIRYDSNSVANGMTAVSNFVLGVAEK